MRGGGGGGSGGNRLSARTGAQEEAIACALRGLSLKALVSVSSGLYPPVVACMRLGGGMNTNLWLNTVSVGVVAVRLGTQHNLSRLQHGAHTQSERCALCWDCSWVHASSD